MVEQPDGRRTLIAPEAEVADFIASTYHFDDVRIEATEASPTSGSFTVTTASLQLAARVGPRTALGKMLQLVPSGVARSPLWCRAVDPIARLLRPGVRTAGTAGAGRREFYCATDEHALTSVRATLDGVDLGELGPVDPPVRFGFGSAPIRPSLVQVTTIIDQTPAKMS